MTELQAPPPVDVVWVLLCAALVMLMQAGFCCLETGLARAKNSINVAIKNLVDFCVAGLAFFLFGFSMMFGTSYLGIIGQPAPILNSQSSSWTIAFLVFQLVFCGTATTIVSGAVAERMRFSSYLWLSLLVSGILYPLFGHWAWSGTGGFGDPGWLAQRGFVDFAGSTVVHGMGGWISLAAIMVIGPRIGRFSGALRSMHGHNLPMATLGVMLLWFGWFGFNGGSALSVTDRVPLILLNTNLGACAGGLAALALAWIALGRPDVTHAITGVVAGLVAITAGCHAFEPTSAILVGAAGGTICFLACQILEWWKIDDVVNAWPAHAVAGAWGTIAVAIFGESELLGTGLGQWEQLQVQSMGVASCALLAFGGGYVVMRIINAIMPLRVSAENELSGLNVSEHGATTEIIDLLHDMDKHRVDGDFRKQVNVEPHTEVGQIAAEYNLVIERVDHEIRRQQEITEQLRQAERRYRRIFEEAIEGIFQTTVDGHYLIANPALARIYGYDSPDQMISSITDIQNQLYVDSNRREEFRLLMERQGMVTGFESEVRRRDGTTAWISENARAVRDDNGRINFYEGTVEDITERKRSLEMQREIRVAQEANRAKSEFLAHMSHEIRTPLNGVIGMMELLARTPLNGRQRHYVDIARSSAGLLLSLINQILDFSKIESGKLEVESHSFNLWQILDETVDLFLPQAHAKGLALTCQIDARVPREVIGDSQRLRQIATNLLGNALKFTSQGSVSLRARLDNEDKGIYRVRFEVADTGIGIPSDRRHRLFQPFSQVDASTTRKFGGTGLGLAISHQIATLLGGSMGVESEEGKGSTFWWTACVLHPRETQIAPMQLTDRIRSLRALVVLEDERESSTVGEWLTAWGIQSELAADANAAMSKIRLAAHSPRPFGLGIIGCDIDLAGRPFAQALPETREASDLPIITVGLSSSDSNQIKDPLSTSAIDLPIRQSKLFDAVMHAVFRDEDAASRATRVRPIDDIAHRSARSFPSGTRVLVAEDNEVNQFVTREILAQEGIECDIVATGKQAVEAAQSRNYAMLLMDCQMPEMDGFEATGMIRQWQKRQENPRRLPILALTASAIRGDRERCLEAGMDDYVTKPIDPEALIAAIKRLLCGEPPAATEVRNHAPPKRTIPRTKANTGPIDDIYNVGDFLSRCLGDRGFAQNLLEKWSQRLRQDADAIKSLVQEGNIQELARRGHALKGAASTLGAHRLAEKAAQLERLSQSEEGLTLAEVVAAVLAEIDQASEFIPLLEERLSEELDVSSSTESSL